jgi:hypothetical protein
MAKIKIFAGQWSSDATSELNLINNHMLDPTGGYDTVIMMAEQRMLMTFIAAGVREGRYTAPADTDSARTKIGVIPDNELIEGTAWKYRIMGRIQKACEILGSAAVGTITSGSSTTGGFFSVTLKDNYGKPGMNAVFYNGKLARCMTMPTGGPGGYVYYFQCYPGDTFDWTTWVAPQAGTKTLFFGFTTYGERSLRGYGNVFYPDHFINHMTIQRKGISISGDANARVIWYDYDGEKGWDWEENQQVRAQFLLEDEFQKWFGKSTMKDSFGNLLASPSMYDAETGEPIYAGDGLVEQISGANDMTTSGTDGAAVYDDFSDMITTIKKKSNTMNGKLYYFVTGSDGMQVASDVIAKFAKDQFNTTVMIDKADMNKIGGADFPVGYNFRTLNVAGNQIVFIEHPMFDDEQKFPRRLSNGKLASSNTFYCLDNSTDATGRRNIEIKAKGRNGVNRNWVLFQDNGMTGEGQARSSVDAKTSQMLKQNMLVCYNTKGCGILAPSLTA